jgi:hypothetical protein
MPTFRPSNTTENRINRAFARLLTPTLALTADSGWLHQNWPVGHTSGFDKTDIGLKYEAFRDNRRETLVSVSLAHSGAQGVGADAPNTIQPGVFFDKEFCHLDQDQNCRPHPRRACRNPQHRRHRDVSRSP